MKIEIKSPCNENWDKMTPKDKGRHCAKCEKVVNDFTQMSEFETIRFLHYNKNVCGRYNITQHNKELALPALQNPWLSSLRKIAFGGLLLSKLTNVKSETFQELDSNQTIMVPAANEQKKITTINGKITQPKEEEFKARTLRFIADKDSFELVIEVNTSNTYSLDLPTHLLKKIKIEVYTEDAVFVIMDQNRFVNENGIYNIDLVYRKSWEWNKLELKIDEHLLDGKVEMCSLLWTNMVFGNVTMVVSGGDINKPDLNLWNKDQKFHKKLVIHEKRSSSKWWWLLPGFLVFIIGAFKWKKGSELSIRK